MSINFEAANMAGYNNPTIEVFKAIVDFGTNAISDAPSKAEIIRCLHRGSIPALMASSAEGSEVYLLWVSSWGSSPDGDTIMIGRSPLIIAYLPDSETPIVSTGG